MAYCFYMSANLQNYVSALVCLSVTHYHPTVVWACYLWKRKHMRRSCHPKVLCKTVVLKKAVPQNHCSAPVVKIFENHVWNIWTPSQLFLNDFDYRCRTCSFSNKVSKFIWDLNIYSKNCFIMKTLEPMIIYRWYILRKVHHFESVSEHHFSHRSSSGLCRNMQISFF